jgi:hypothetical protein
MAKAFRKKLRRAFIDIDSSSKERDIICNYEQKQTLTAVAPSGNGVAQVIQRLQLSKEEKKDQIRRTDKGGGEPRWAI